MKLKNSHFIMSVSGEAIYSFIKETIPVLLILFLFLNPIPHTTAIKEICFYLSFILLIILLYFKKTDFFLHTPLLQPFLLFVVWCIFGLIFALNKQNSFHDVYAHLIKYIAVYYLLVNFINTRKRFIYLIWSIIASATIFSIGEMTQFYFIMGKSISTKLGFEHLTELPSNTIGIVTVFAIALSIPLLRRDPKLYRKGLLILCILFLSMATLLTKALSALIAMGFLFIIIFPKNKKVMTALFLFLFAAATLLPIKEFLRTDYIINKIKNDERIKIGFMFIEMTKDYPITGIGFGMQTYYDKALLDKYNSRVPIQYKQIDPHKAPHNFMIDVAVRTGFVGLGLFLYILFASIRMSWNVIRQAKDYFFSDWELCCMGALFAILIQGLFENTMSGPPAIILYTIFAMMTILWRLHMESVTVMNKQKDAAP